MHNSERCAIGMGLCAIGKLHKRGEIHDILHDPNHVELRAQWPWVTLPNAKNGNGYYGYRPYHGTYEESLYDAFDSQVMHHKTMTLEALCDQVRMWEEELSAKGVDVEQVGGITPEQVSMAAELNQPVQEPDVVSQPVLEGESE